MYTIPENYVEVIGRIWQPDTEAYMKYTLQPKDIESLKTNGAITHDSIALWLSTHAGDFQSITDFHADIDAENLEFDWTDKENGYKVLEILFQD